MMKKSVFFLFFFSLYISAPQAQPGASGKKPVSYTNFMTLHSGEKVIPLYSCMWLNANNDFYQLAIQTAGGKYSVITSEGRKDNVSQEEVRGYFASSSNCADKDPHKPRKSTRYMGSKLVKINAKGKSAIVAGKKNYGPFEEILHISEIGQKFVAVVRILKNGKQEILYIDSEGRQHTLTGKPLDVITNTDLSKAAVVLPPADAMPMELLNKLPYEKRVEYLDKLAKQEQSIWFNNDSSGILARQYRRLEYDISGKHFMVVYNGYILIDGKRIDVNISAAGTRFFAGNDPGNWAAYSSGYLNFSDKTSIKDAINPFLSTEGDKHYVTWFKIESTSAGEIIKRGKKEL